MAVYHAFTKSIAGFKIFNHEADFKRIIMAIRYYQFKQPGFKFSVFYNKTETEKEYFIERLVSRTGNRLVNVVAYCIMPTHIHIGVEELEDVGISFFMKNVLNSYTRYFNTRYRRKGPLWEGRFKRIEVENDGHLLHLSRYIHLNPVTSYLVERPEDWPASSYGEYINVKEKGGICSYRHLLPIESELYEEFVNGQISYQRELAEVKSLTADQSRKFGKMLLGFGFCGEEGKNKPINHER